MSGKIPCIPKGGARVPKLDLLPLHFQLQDVTRVSFGSRDREVLDRRRLRGGERYAPPCELAPTLNHQAPRADNRSRGMV